MLLVSRLVREAVPVAENILAEKIFRMEGISVGASLSFAKFSKCLAKQEFDPSKVKSRVMIVERRYAVTLTTVDRLSPTFFDSRQAAYRVTFM